MTRAAALAAAALLALAATRAWALGPFIVFFDSGSARLSIRAEAILANAVEQARLMDVRELLVEGHADRAGPAAANLALSRRRAEAAKAALVRHGFPAERIVVTAHGESRPLVETADGVAEPQNRFVTVILARICRMPPELGFPDSRPPPGC